MQTFKYFWNAYLGSGNALGVTTAIKMSPLESVGGGFHGAQPPALCKQTHPPAAGNVTVSLAGNGLPEVLLPRRVWRAAGRQRPGQCQGPSPHWGSLRSEKGPHLQTQWTGLSPAPSTTHLIFLQGRP